jgi:bacteriocin-like protein
MSEKSKNLKSETKIARAKALKEEFKELSLTEDELKQIQGGTGLKNKVSFVGHDCGDGPGGDR